MELPTYLVGVMSPAFPPSSKFGYSICTSTWEADAWSLEVMMDGWAHVICMRIHPIQDEVITDARSNSPGPASSKSVKDSNHASM